MNESATACVLLTHDVGLHARPSVKLTKLAKTFHASIRLGLSSEGPWIDAKSINKVMGARVPKDTMLFFEADGIDADEAVDALLELVARDFQDDEPASAG